MTNKLNSEKWLIIPKTRDELLIVTRDLITEIRELSDNNIKLTKLKNNEELIIKLDEVLNEIDLQYDKIILTIKTSELVYTHLKSLRIIIEKIYFFFNDLSKIRIMFFAKNKLRKQMILLYNNLRHSCTQLMACVSLELLTIKNNENNDIPVTSSLPTELPDKDLIIELLEGHKFFYGINKFKNYIRAFKHYVYAAERGQLDAMIMVAKIYQNGYGIEKDLNKAIAWYKRAEEFGSPASKYYLAFLLLDEVVSFLFFFIKYISI